MECNQKALSPSRAQLGGNLRRGRRPTDELGLRRSGTSPESKAVSVRCHVEVRVVALKARPVEEVLRVPVRVKEDLRSLPCLQSGLAAVCEHDSVAVSRYFANLCVGRVCQFPCVTHCEQTNDGRE